MDCSPPGSSVHVISQARILEWVTTSFSRGSSWPRDQTKVSCTGWVVLDPEPHGKPHLYRAVCLLSCIQIFATPWTVALQVPLSLRFSRQEHWMAQSSKISCNFLSDKSTRSTFCSNEVTLSVRIFLDGCSWIDAGHQENQALIRSLEFSTLPSPNLFRNGREDRNEGNDWSYADETSQVWGFKELFVWWTHLHTGRVIHPNSTGVEAPALWNLPHLTFISLYLSYCSSVSFIT